MADMTTSTTALRAALIRIRELTPTEMGSYTTTLKNEEVVVMLAGELLSITKRPPGHMRFRERDTPNLSELAKQWWGGRQGDPLSALLRQAMDTVDAGHCQQLRTILLPRNSDLGVSQRDIEAGVGENQRKRVLIPALAGGMYTALDEGPQEPDIDPEWVERLLTLLRPDRQPLAEALLDDMERQNARPTLQGWVGPVWAWWWNDIGQPAEKFRFIGDGRAVARAPWIAAEPGGHRVAITMVPPVVSDPDTIDLGTLPIPHHHVKEIERSGDAYRERHPDSSPFLLRGDKGVWPGLLAIHCVVQTRDGWLIVSRRASRAPGNAKYPPYFPARWSLSFEEQADPAKGDSTIADAAARGLWEEFRVTCSPRQVQCHLLGRECVPIPTVTGGFVLNAAAFCTIQLDQILDNVWAKIPFAPDYSEHDAWLACKLETKTHLEQALRATTIEEFAEPGRIRFFNPNEPSTGPLRWHPTSRARLALWGLRHLHG